MLKIAHFNKVILILFFVLFGCIEKKVAFDKHGWNEEGDGKPCPPLRESMLDDLLQTHKIKGLTYHQLISKLGEADNGTWNTVPEEILRYNITMEYTSGDVVHVKTVDFYYKDSVITSWHINKFDIDM